jgi:hypothetical protein
MSNTCVVWDRAEKMREEDTSEEGKEKSFMDYFAMAEKDWCCEDIPRCLEEDKTDLIKSLQLRKKEFRPWGENKKYATLDSYLNSTEFERLRFENEHKVKAMCVRNDYDLIEKESEAFRRQSDAPLDENDVIWRALFKEVVNRGLLKNIKHA